MRKALIVGINHYSHFKSLKGCVRDAYSLNSVLERHGDGTINFHGKLLTVTGKEDSISKSELKDQIIELFNTEHDAIFYFSGHGHLEETGGYLVTSECKQGDEGMSMDELLNIANRSKAKNKIIILDCCHSGYAGSDFQSDKALLTKGTTILTAAAKDQYALEINESGVFTSLLVDALTGGAANLMGKITPGSVYAHIDQSLGPWEQRPLFKTNIENFISLRDVNPPIMLNELRQIISLFDEKGTEFQLDPSFEPAEESCIKENTDKFALLQKFEGVGLVIPVGAEHMYYAAMESKHCALTLLGQHYWTLVKKEKI